jgi:predicted metal-dependent hydrolase
MRAAPPKELKPLERSLERDIFQAEVEAWMKKMRVRPKVVHVRAMKRKWGSCSTSGRVTLDSNLLRQHAEFRKRVIVEELLHLRVPNHGKLFKTLLGAYLSE